MVLKQLSLLRGRVGDSTLVNSLGSKMSELVSIAQGMGISFCFRREVSIGVDVYL